MSRVPDRTRTTYFIGAGFSSAFELPNTASLLRDVHRLAKRHRLLIEEHLRSAYGYFYPEKATTFVPDVVDFFSVLRAYTDIAHGLPGGFKPLSLLADLKFVVARLLCEAVREVQVPAPPAPWRTADEIVRVGNTVITSNWDQLIERIARERKVPLRIGGEPSDTVLTLIKLHGSVDWTTEGDRVKGMLGFAALREIQNAARPYTFSIVGEDVVRIRALEHMKKNWQYVRNRTRQPLMIVMSQGKTTDIKPIEDQWSAAYRALGETQNLHIIGYSMPPDDIEIRALLRAGVTRGSPNEAVVSIRNPDPGVHVRIRTYVARDAKSDYRPFVVR